MSVRLLAAAALALVAGAASAQPPPANGPRGAAHGPGPGGFGLLTFDANADGKLTKTEFEAGQRARFEKLDANKDGTATPDEVQAARKAEMETLKAAAAKERFAGLDKDKNGQLSQAEFAAGAPAGPGTQGPPRGGPRPERVGMQGPPGGRDHYRDGPGDGAQGRARDDGPQRAGPADANADGKLTLAEFTARGVEAFNRADANKDATVTIAELQAAPGGRR